MNVQGVGGVQIPAAIRNDIAYLAVSDVLDYLKIKNTTSPGMDSISGFFILQQATFVIDPVHNRIVYQGKILNCPRMPLSGQRPIYISVRIISALFSA
jgi:hypothetical protein